MNEITIKRALISVSNKKGIIELAKTLHTLNIEIISTGGTYRVLQEAGIPVTSIQAITHFPEMMNGRVKTLHPNVFAGLLQRGEKDAQTLKTHHINPIDLVIVNLYPFVKTIADPKASFADAIENIDIGGPSMIRAAAKNYLFTTVITEPDDYQDLSMRLSTHQGRIDETLRLHYAHKAFTHTAAYDVHIANYLHQQSKPNQTYPDLYLAAWHKKENLRYGENPHQSAAFYQEAQPAAKSIAACQRLQGKALSYNNIADGNTALDTVKQFVDCACVIVKHANPCGVALGKDPLQAYQKAFATDPTSSFGGIIAFNREVDLATADCIINNQFVEVVIAPQFSKEACECFAAKKNVRLLAHPQSQDNLEQPVRELFSNWDLKRTSGGLLVQTLDNLQISAKDLQIVTERKPTDSEINDLLFAWQVVRYVKSNAVVFAKDQTTVAIGAGQMSRIFSIQIARLKAKDANLTLTNAVMASDAFLPFADNITAIEDTGVTAIIQPGGSIKDEAVITAANKANIAMVFTNIRHFWH